MVVDVEGERKDNNMFEKHYIEDTIEVNQLKRRINELLIENKKLKKINQSVVMMARDERRIMFEQYKPIHDYSKSAEINAHNIDPFVYQIEIKFDRYMLKDKFATNKLFTRYIHSKVLPDIGKKLIKIFRRDE